MADILFSKLDWSGDMRTKKINRFYTGIAHPNAGMQQSGGFVPGDSDVHA